MLESRTQKVLVTGASGMIGTAVVSHLLKRGYFVRTLSHTHVLPHGTEAVSADMRDANGMRKAVQGMDVVIHLAARKSDEEDSEAVNVQGARNLGSACLDMSVSLLINVSTQSVKLKRKGIYAATKAKADEILTQSGVPTVTLLPSVVYTDLESGILGSIQGFLKLPIVPVIGEGTPTFRPISAADLAAIIERCIERKSGVTGKQFDVGGSEEISMNGLIDLMMRHEGVRRFTLHLPIPVALSIAKILRCLKNPPITVSNVLGAAENVPMTIEPITSVTGCAPKGIREGLSMLFKVRRQHAEPSALLRYVLGLTPTPAMIERYERAVAQHGLDATHRIDEGILRKKWLLQGLDAISRIRHPSCALQRKLLIAAAIGECSRESADALLPKDRTKIVIIMKCIVIAAQEAFSLLVGSFLLLFSPAFFRRNAGL